MSVAKRVGNYELLGNVGERGGMAVVFLARQARLGRRVALKQVDLRGGGDLVERFVREARLAGSLSHPNIVTLHDFFEHDGVPYIAMEYLERGSLRPWIGRLSLAQSAGVLEGVLAALAHAHDHGIVHRDVKPENILVGGSGAVKLADFGIARAFAKVTGRLTATGMTVGTPAYMAPEQAMNLEIGPRSDLYSTGVVAYEMLLGRLPFEDSDLPVAMLLRHVREPIPPPRELDPGLDARIAAWLEQMLAKEPEARPASAVTAWEQLEDAVVGVLGPVWRRHARLLEALDTSAATTPLTPAPFHDPGQPVESPAGVSENPAAPDAGYEHAGYLTFTARPPPRPPTHDSPTPARPTATPLAAKQPEAERDLAPPAGVPVEPSTGPATLAPSVGPTTGRAAVEPRLRGPYVRPHLRIPAAATGALALVTLVVALALMSRGSDPSTPDPQRQAALAPTPTPTTATTATPTTEPTSEPTPQRTAEPTKAPTIEPTVEATPSATADRPPTAKQLMRWLSGLYAEEPEIFTTAWGLGGDLYTSERLGKLQELEIVESGPQERRSVFGEAGVVHRVVTDLTFDLQHPPHLTISAFVGNSTAQRLLNLGMGWYRVG